MFQIFQEAGATTRVVFANLKIVLIWIISLSLGWEHVHKHSYIQVVSFQNDTSTFMTYVCNFLIFISTIHVMFRKTIKITIFNCY